MRFRLSHRVVLGSTALAGLCFGTVAATAKSPDAVATRRSTLPPALARPVTFEKEVLPLLKQRCFACHSGSQRQGGLRLDRREALLQGGDSGAALVPGKSAESLLVQYVAGLEPGKIMPPAGKRLTPAEIGLLRAWIDQGAAWQGGQGSGVGGRASDQVEQTHWAFVAPTLPAVPKVRARAWVKNPIDAFVLASLEKEGIRPSPYASRPTLIRRLSMDLTGLPPTPREVEAFVTDRSPDAYEKVVDRLLASPHFGERWGRHWLDLARYADSDGYEKDLARPYAYLYRDWVIQAFNRDMPFDQFTVEQLAGDLLPNATLDQKIATGFHRNTLKNREGGVDQEEDRVKNTVDRVSTTGTAWLGLTVACAECHTHKYDPITQREFYGIYAFFNSVDEVDVPAPTPAELEAYRKAREKFDREHAGLQANLKTFEQDELPARLAAWEQRVAAEKPKLPASIGEVLNLPSDKRSAAQKQELAQHFRSVDPEYGKLAKAVEDHLKKAPARPARIAMTLAERPEPRPTHIHLRGDFLRKGAAVEPHTLAVLPALSTASAPTANARTSGATPAPVRPTRLDLARWIASPENPLTARVAVNRTWQYLFGRGLVATPNDFGTRGDRPSHPELLDYLAVAFATGAGGQGTGAGGRGSGARGRGSEAGGGVTTAPIVSPNPMDEWVNGVPGEQDGYGLADRGGAREKGAGGSLNLRTAAASDSRGSGYALRNTNYGGTSPLAPRPSPLPQGLSWSTKKLIKLIVMSATYQQSSRSRPDLEERDPKNILLARQSRFRVEAEVVRDLYLAASGLLNPEIGGPSIRPPLPADIAALGYANSVKWAESKGAERYKRGMYIFYQRTVPYPMLSTFDAPDSNTACTRRERSNTPLQALTLLNDPVFMEAAQALGKRVLKEGPDDAAGRVDYAFRLCLGRAPSNSEAARLLALHADMLQSFRKAPAAAKKFAGAGASAEGAAEQAAWTAVARIILNLDEFVTRE